MAQIFIKDNNVFNEGNWYYAGEGNKNLVIYFLNREEAYRFIKTSINNNVDESCLDKLEYKIVKRIYFYHQRLILPMLNPYVSEVKGIELKTEDVEKLNKTFANIRPPYRLHKTLRCRYVLVFRNFTKLPKRCIADNVPVFTVEIKPKQGWVPISDRNSSLCSFCIHQYFKISDASEKSKYCPMDLYSGDSYRMKKALLNLFENPQNNFKILLRGRVGYNRKHTDDYKYRFISQCLNDDQNKGNELIEKLMNLVITALTTNCDFPNNNRLSKIRKTQQVSDKLPLHYNSKRNCCLIEDPELTPGCVLDILYRMQMLNQHGIAYIYKVYEEFVKTKMKPEDNKYKLIDYLLENTDHYEGCTCVDQKNEIISDICEKHQYEDILTKYLLFSTARDCSIMLTFRYIPECYSNNVINKIRCEDGKEYEFTVGVIDLDPKPLNCIEKHYRQKLQALSRLSWSEILI